MSTHDDHAYDSTLGAALIGLTLTSILYGVTFLQCFMYFSRYSKDNITLKALVSSIWLLDTVHTATVLHLLYFYLVTNYANTEALNLVVWSLALEVGLTAIAAVLVQSFFIWRVWRLSSNNLIVTGIIVILSFIAIVSGLGCMIEAFLLGTISNLKKIQWTAGVKHTSVAAADIGVTIAQCWYLHYSRTGFKSTDTLINTLIIYTVNRGILNSIAAVANLACFLAMPNNFVWLALDIIMSKLYTNSLLATLNTRDSLRGRGTDTDLESTRPTFHLSPLSKNGSGNTDTDLTGSRPSDKKPTAVSIQIEATQQVESLPPSTLDVHKYYQSDDVAAV